MTGGRRSRHQWARLVAPGSGRLMRSGEHDQERPRRRVKLGLIRHGPRRT